MVNINQPRLGRDLTVKPGVHDMVFGHPNMGIQRSQLLLRGHHAIHHLSSHLNTSGGSGPMPVAGIPQINIDHHHTLW